MRKTMLEKKKKRSGFMGRSKSRVRCRRGSLKRSLSCISRKRFLSKDLYRLRSSVSSSSSSPGVAVSLIKSGLRIIATSAAIIASSDLVHLRIDEKGLCFNASLVASGYLGVTGMFANYAQCVDTINHLLAPWYFFSNWMSLLGRAILVTTAARACLNF